jgi:anaerobic selenocysteine-containing dehydrogenase
MGERVVRQHLCPLCEAGCGLDIHVEGGRVSLIRGNRDDVFSGGYLCPKGSALGAFQDDEDRLRRPLVKRDGSFVEVTFDEAFVEVEKRLLPVLEANGPLGSGLVIGNPTVHRTGLVLYVPDLAAALGTPNVFSTATLDQMPKQLAVGKLYGNFYSLPVPDIERTDLLVILGANPMVSNGSMWSVPDFRGKARALIDRGGRIVTIDPRRHETAELADPHIPIRPGTDVFLLAAIVHTIHAEGHVDLGSVADLVDRGALQAIFDAVQAFTPAAVAPVCGIEVAAIVGLARDLAAAERAAVYGRIGTCHQLHATVTSWLIEVVNIITDNLDRPGGVMFACPAAFSANTEPLAAPAAGVTTGTYRSRVSNAPEVMNQFPLACLAEEIETPGVGQIKALVTLAANPVLSGPDGPRLAAALDEIDVMISFDVYLNETTRHADVIIPGPTPLEEGHYDVYFSQFMYRNVTRYTPAALPKDGDVPDDWEALVRLIAILQGKGADADVRDTDDRLFRELLSSRGIEGEAAEAAATALAPRVGAERRLDLALRSGPYGDRLGGRPEGINLDRLEAEPNGVDHGPLSPRLPDALRTPSGCIDIAPEDFVAALRHVAIELGTHPEPGECLLVGRRHLRSNNSWMHNLPILAKGRDKCVLLVHPDDVVRWGLTADGRATVSSPDTGATVEATVRADDSMMAGVVSLPHGYGHHLDGSRLSVAAVRPGVNVNVLVSAERRDPLSGNAALSGIPVTIAPLGG